MNRYILFSILIAALTVSQSFGQCTSVNNPNQMTVTLTVSNVGCDSIDNGMASALNKGGAAPFTYTWDAGTGGQTTSTAGNLATGIYHVTVTDSNGCKAIGAIAVGQDLCPPPCPINPCEEVIVNNDDICVILAGDPGDPLSTIDCDGDGVLNPTECVDGTDPLDPCDYLDTSITDPVTADQSDCPRPCPDLSPVMTILPGNIAGWSAVEVAIQVNELASVDTDGSPIIVRMPSDTRYVFVWNIGLTIAALVPVQNPQWNYLGNNGLVHTWTYNGPGIVIQADSTRSLGFQGFYDPESTDGQTTFTATVLPTSGGECNFLNNTDSERLVYFK